MLAIAVDRSRGTPHRERDGAASADDDAFDHGLAAVRELTHGGRRRCARAPACRARLSLRGGLCLLGLLLVPAREPLDAAGRVDDLLLSGEERVTVAAHLDLELGPRRARHEGVAARAADDLRQHVSRVDALFHDCASTDTRRRSSRAGLYSTRPE